MKKKSKHTMQKVIFKCKGLNSGCILYTMPVVKNKCMEKCRRHDSTEEIRRYVFNGYEMEIKYNMGKRGRTGYDIA